MTLFLTTMDGCLMIEEREFDPLDLTRWLGLRKLAPGLLFMF